MPVRKRYQPFGALKQILSGKVTKKHFSGVRKRYQPFGALKLAFSQYSSSNILSYFVRKRYQPFGALKPANRAGWLGYITRSQRTC